MRGTRLNEIDGHIPLQGAENTRDLGYLSTVSGQKIKPRQLLRSGSLDHLTEQDIGTLLKEYHLKTVIDLRTPEEHADSSSTPQIPGATYYNAPVLGQTTEGITRESGFFGKLKTINALKRNPKQHLTNLYPIMVLGEDGIAAFRAFFDILLEAPEGAVLWHCSAGKDRTGLATALLLYALGVSEENIAADYLTTNNHLVSIKGRLEAALPKWAQTKALMESLQVMRTVDQDYLAAAKQAIEEKHKSIDNYLEQALELDARKQTALQVKYLV